jgi:hypothetical protein
MSVTIAGIEFDNVDYYREEDVLSLCGWANRDDPHPTMHRPRGTTSNSTMTARSSPSRS